MYIHKKKSRLAIEHEDKKLPWIRARGVNPRSAMALQNLIQLKRMQPKQRCLLFAWQNGRRDHANQSLSSTAGLQRESRRNFKQG